MFLYTLIGVGLLVAAQAGSPWPKSAYDNAQKVLDQMTFDEKMAMVHGNHPCPDPCYVGFVPGNERLNIPPWHYEDGPQGVADGTKNVTAFPSALSVVASWDTKALYDFGRGMSVEQYLKGTNVLLGPMVNLARVPLGGRNFESFGEDPYLASTLVQPEIKGIQSFPVSACIKHFIDNSQELARWTVSENVPQRAQWELYYPAFQAAVDAGVGTAMASYNRVNNSYASANNQTLYDLKTRMGFDGFVMSDWGATHSTVKAALAGLDQEMPGDQFFGNTLAEAVQNGSVPQSRVDDMVYRMLVTFYALGLVETRLPAT